MIESFKTRASTYLYDIAYLPNPISSPIVPVKFDIYDPTSNSWSIGALNQYIPTTSGIVSTGNAIYIAGGSTFYSNSTQ